MDGSSGRLAGARAAANSRGTDTSFYIKIFQRSTNRLRVLTDWSGITNQQRLTVVVLPIIKVSVSNGF